MCYGLQLACHSKVGENCLWGAFGAPGSPYKLGDVVSDSAVDGAGNEELVIPCLGRATLDGSDVSGAMSCYSGGPPLRILEIENAARDS